MTSPTEDRPNDTARLQAALTVIIDAEGDYYVDHADLIANVVPWIEGGLDDRDDIRNVTITEQAPPVVVPSAPADRAASIPPAADGLPPGALDSAANGASALDAWARDPHGRNFLAHALVQLARDGWLRAEPGEGFEPVRDRETAEPEDPDVLRRMADEAPCGCGHAADEHSVYGCADGCACEWMPKRPPMDPVHILGIEAPADEAPQPEGEAPCTCADAGECFAPAGHYADCPSAEVQR